MNWQICSIKYAVHHKLRIFLDDAEIGNAFGKLATNGEIDNNGIKR